MADFALAMTWQVSIKGASQAATAAGKYPRVASPCLASASAAQKIQFSGTMLSDLIECTDYFTFSDTLVDAGMLCHHGKFSGGDALASLPEREMQRAFLSME